MDTTEMLRGWLREALAEIRASCAVPVKRQDSAARNFRATPIRSEADEWGVLATVG